MICSKCGQELREQAKFCSRCGTEVVEANPVITDLKTGDEVELGTIPGSAPDAGKLKWQVLNIRNNMVLIICKQGICVKTYHKTQTEITWSECSLREWLNSDFVNKYFSQSERNRILVSNVTNPDNPQYKTAGGDATNDKVFLLSLSEAEFLFADDRARAIGSYWWLRTPGMYPNFAACVNKHGRIEPRGYYVYGNSLCDDITVRPVMWIRIG